MNFKERTNMWLVVIGFIAVTAMASVISLAFVAGQRMNELRDDTNRVSRVVSECAYAIEKGYYTPVMMNQCIDDYLMSGGKVEPDLP